ncbi:hypothetical protein LJB42_000464 [Komagataella kurtzmanii]|nr:hypothetical protein LJB42_000464 [Komagataella kurtzmanii]
MTESLFQHEVGPAIQAAIEQQKFLLIYSTTDGEDKWGDELILNNPKFPDLVKGKAITFKLVQGSRDFDNFKQVFPGVTVPSVIVINAGQVVDLLQGPLTRDEFNNRITKILSTQVKTSSNPLPKKEKESESSLRKDSRYLAAEIYKKEQRKRRQQEKEERERILELVRLDQRERKRRQSSSSNDKDIVSEPLVENVHSTHDNDEMYIIQLRLFDGTAIRHAFNSRDTLENVRHFITESYPEYQQKTYYFYKPLQRITFSDTDEFKSLFDLKLNRASLILKPREFYGTGNNTDSSFTPAGSSIFGRIQGFIGSVMGHNQTTASSTQESTKEESSEDHVEDEEFMSCNGSMKSPQHSPLLRSEGNAPFLSHANQSSLNLNSSASNFSVTEPHRTEEALSRPESRNSNSMLSSRINSSTRIRTLNHQGEDPDKRQVFNGNNLDLVDDKNK